MSNVQLLDGLKVVDLGVGMAPALASKMLADMGARVKRVAPIGGDPFSAIYPAYDVWHRGASMDAEAASSPERLEQLLAEADICVMGGEDHPELVRRADAALIAQRHPRLVVLDIADGPAATDYCGRPSTELLAQVRCGLAQEQLPDRPIVNTFEPASYGAALQGLIGLLSALYERQTSDRGQVVSTSLFEGSLAWIASYWAQLEKPTPAANFVIPKGVMQLIFRTQDGAYLQVLMGSKGSKYGLYKVLGIDDPTVLPDDSGMPKPGGNQRNFFGDYDLLAEYVAKQNLQELLQALWAHGLPAEPVLPPGVCWDEPQIARNGVIVTDVDGTRHVGLPFLFKTSGENTSRKPLPAGRRPLDGVSVIDCGAFVAGPLGSVLLADLGADVIKVEALEGDPNRSIFRSFTAANRGKQGLSVDLKSPEGRALLQSLCQKADVVMNNFRPGVSSRLGVDPVSLHARKPELIVLESPAYGSEGPLSAKPGFDMIAQAWCGHDVKAAGRGNAPRWNRTNIVDITGGMLGAISILASLVHRARTGHGVALELPLVNAGIFTLSELVQRPDGKREGVQVLSSSLSGYHPSESLYQTKDGWVAVVARGQRAAMRLRSLLGLVSLISADVAEWDEQTEAAIAKAVSGYSSTELQALLEPAGVWVEVSRTDREAIFLNDPELIRRGTVRAVSHPTFGLVRELGTMFKLSRSASGNNRSAPLPGGSTCDILQAEGYDQATINDLLARGVMKAA